MLQADRDFRRALLLTLFLVFLVMACQFESIARPFVVMGTVVLSALGAVAALALCGVTVTAGVLVGLLMLGGIVVNNGIMYVDRVQQMKAEGMAEGFSLLLLAGRQRMRPIFMTTTTTVLGLMPLALDRSESAALWSPLAITVIGGLITATVLTLLVIPCCLQIVESLPAVLRERTKNCLQRWRPQSPPMLI
jgi:hydrophobic/amphiphilic exporter-1 (mainly G- bacteria), HAE1 family